MRIKISPPDIDLIDDNDMDKQGVNAWYLAQKDGICVTADDMNVWPVLISFASNPTTGKHVPLNPNGYLSRPRHKVQTLNDFWAMGESGDILYVVSQ